MSSSISTRSGLDYEPGDCFGIFPSNDPALADAVAGRSACRSAPISRSAARSLRRRLIEDCRSSPAPDVLFQLIWLYLRRRRRGEQQGARRWPRARTRTATRRPLDVLARASRNSGIRPDPEAFIEALEPLQPRLYSISSSPRANPGRVQPDGRRRALRSRRAARLGVASTFLADRVPEGDPLEVYVQKAHGFAPARRSGDADHHGRPGHRHRAVPRVPAGAAGNQGAGPALAVLRPPARGDDFFYRDELEDFAGEAAR